MNEATSPIIEQYRSPAIEPEALDAADSAAFVGVAKSTFLEWDNTGQLGPEACMRIGRCVRWSRTELRAWLLAGTPVRGIWKSQRSQAVKAITK